jgi:fibronectin type III domain protein
MDQSTRTRKSASAPKIAIIGLLAAVAVPALGIANAGATTPVAPSAPTGVMATGGYQGAEVNWTVGANGGDPITGFAVTAYLNGTAAAHVTVSAGAAGSSLSPTPGANDTWDDNAGQGASGITFSVAAINAAGTGTTSSQTNVVNFSATPTVPYAPTVVTAATGATSGVTVDWTVPSNNGAAISSFTLTPILVSTTEPSTTLLAGAVGSAQDPTPGASDSATITGLTAGDSYSFTVVATNTVGAGPASAQSNAATATGSVAPPSTTTVTASPASIDFGDVTLGDIGDTSTITLTNTGNAVATISGIEISGVGQDDFISPEDPGTCDTTIAIGGSCTINAVFLPGAVGLRTATLTPTGNWSPQTNISFSGVGTEGYYIVRSTGKIDAFGDAQLYGDGTNDGINVPPLGMISTGDDGGYWLFDADGDVIPFGDANYWGDASGLHLNKPIVGMAVTPDGGGYWLVSSDGGIFAFGDAPYKGSTGAIHLNKPIVGMAASPDGNGYWLVASDGGIFSFGDSQFQGSTGAIHLNKPIVGMAATPDGGGYWMVASDGGIFAFGDAPYKGSTGAIKLARPIVGMAAAPDGNGYWIVASDGGVFAFGAPYLQSDGGQGITDAVGIAIDDESTFQAEVDIPAARRGGGGGPEIGGGRSYQE